MNSKVSIALFVCFVVGASAQCQLQTSDVNVLNYALSLERLEANFYTGLSTQATLNVSAFANVGVNISSYNYLQLIAAHEIAHVNFLVSTLNSSGCPFVPACTYNFTAAYADPISFLETAYALESTGVGAYNGAINTIFAAAVRTAAATIVTVEARHTAFLGALLNPNTGVFSNLTGVNNSAPYQPFPNIFDAGLTVAQVQNNASPFFAQYNATCGSNVTLTVQQCAYTDALNTVPTVNQTSCRIIPNGVAVLNYALTLEYLEAAFYAQAIANTTLQASIGASRFVYIQLIAAHEAAHVAYLRNTLSIYGCAAQIAPACNYNFGTSFDNATNFYNTAALLENTGVSAYNGAIASLRDSNLRAAAATIATVEGRHAAYLNLLVNSTPFPNTFDPAITASQIVAAVVGTNFITSCPNNFSPVGLAANVSAIGSVDLTCPNVTATTGNTTQSTTVAATTVGATTGVQSITTGLQNQNTATPPSAGTSTGASSTLKAGAFMVLAAVMAVMVL